MGDHPDALRAEGLTVLAMKVEFFYNWNPWRKIRGLMAVIKAGLLAVAKEWHDNYLGDHFLDDAGAKYGYAARSSDYRHLKLTGHTSAWGEATRQSHYKGILGAPDLVFTGRLRDACRTYRHYTGSIGAGGRVTAMVKMHVGHLRGANGFQYALARYRSGLYIPDEISTLTAEEGADLAKYTLEPIVMAFLRKKEASAARARAEAAAEAFAEGSLEEGGFGEGSLAA